MLPAVKVPRCILCRRQIPKGFALIHERCPGPPLKGPNYELEEYRELRRSRLGKTQ